MSEETPTEAPLETPQTEAAAPEAPEAAPEGVNLDQTVTVDGNTYTIKELTDQVNENQVLRDYQKAASNLMRNETQEVTPERESDIRYVMTYEGYQPDQIDNYVNSLKGQQVDPNPQLSPESAPQQEAIPQADPRVDQMDRRIQDIEARERQLRVDALKGKLDNAVMKATSESAIESISNAFKRIHGDEGHQERVDTIREDIHRETISHLRRVRSSGGEIDDGSIAQASQRAAEAVAQRYRTVIGDPDKLGRTPETASGNTQFFKKKPIEFPQFKPGKDTTASVYEKAKTFAEDTLLDIAADVSKGGDSKL